MCLTKLFQHSPLRNSWHLRLVELLPPVSGELDEIVQCKIHFVPRPDAETLDPHYDMSQCANKIPYRALSYHWGESACKETIELDGWLFEVTTNLHAYLTQRKEHNKSIML